MERMWNWWYAHKSSCLTNFSNQTQVCWGMSARFQQLFYVTSQSTIQMFSASIFSYYLNNLLAFQLYTDIINQVQKMLIT